MTTKKTNEVPASRAAVLLDPLIRPVNCPVLSCRPKCGHTDQEHIAFDLGVHDGENGTTIPPVQCSLDTVGSLLLREAWMSGFSIGELNRSNVAGELPTPAEKQETSK